jgi:hypothetical protein
MRKVITAATIALAVVGVAGRGRTAPAPSATRATRVASVALTTTQPASTTAPAKHRTAHPRPTVTTTRPVATVGVVPRTTSTSKPARPAVDRTQTLKACLELATANNFRTISANRAWYQHQLGGPAQQKKMSRARYDELVIEQAQTQAVIQAQYSIDVANCYIKNA